LITTVEERITNDLSEDAVVLDGKLRLGTGATVFPGTRFEAPIYVADGAKVLNGVSLGRYSYVGRNSIVAYTTIGRYCSIAHDCQINNFRNHPTTWLSTHPFQYDAENFEFFANYADFHKRTFFGDVGQGLIRIGSDVWIGAEVGIFGGVTIGVGSIIGARALVTKDLSVYSIAQGSPAKVVRKRFDESIMNRLLASRWWDLNPRDLYSLPFDDVHACLRIMEERKAERNPGAE
jgi:virginiamycin A acetyltransferase